MKLSGIEMLPPVDLCNYITVQQIGGFNKHSSYHGYRGDSGRKLRKHSRSHYNHAPLI